MKRNLFYLLPLLLIFTEACSTHSDNTPIPAPLGTFSGTFRLLVKKTTGSGYDTVKKNTNLIISLTTPNHFKVTGDTTTIHAGSRGLFQYNGVYIAFLDSTFKAGTPQTKIHLTDTYNYLYDGTILIFQRNNTALDSIFRYDFSKTSN